MDVYGDRLQLLTIAWSLLFWVTVAEMALVEEEEDLLTECTEKVRPTFSVQGC